MKKILVFLVTVLCLSSCLGDSSYSTSYPLDITFECSESVYQKYFSPTDSIYVLTGQDLGFYWQDPSIIFGQKHQDGVFKGGFTMSYLKGEPNGKLTKEPNDNDTYRVFASSGASASRCYAVFYENPDSMMMPADQFAFSYKDLGTCEMFACYVNNTTLVARKIMENFQKGDKLTFQATGYLDGKETAQTSVVLAEYTETKDSIMYNWSVFDLSKLGAIDRIKFDVQSTNSAVPSYVCLDGIYTKISLEY